MKKQSKNDTVTKKEVDDWSDVTSGSSKARWDWDGLKDACSRACKVGRVEFDKIIIQVKKGSLTTNEELSPSQNIAYRFYGGTLEQFTGAAIDKSNQSNRAISKMGCKIQSSKKTGKVALVALDMRTGEQLPGRDVK